jgi:vancomycin resistance protein VanW
MYKKRKLFCEYGPIPYKISFCKECLRRDLKDIISNNKFATKIDKNNYPCLLKGEAKLLRRKLHGVDMQLQENKITNLKLACEKIDGIIVYPNEVFSFWKIAGRPTRKKGYLNGLTIENGNFKEGIGGGLCQLANLIHLLVLNTSLKVEELHHHTDALFPDFKRTVPFGTGTSIVYKNVDYRFRNTLDEPVQIRVWLDDLMLYGEIRSSHDIKYRYRLTEEDNYYAKEDGIYYRNSKVYRLTYDRETKELLNKELILVNHSKVMYDYTLIPKEQIRE